MPEPLYEHPLVRQAQELAEHWHADQVRKYPGYPYVTHCERVASLVAMVRPSPPVVAAAWLHDVLEDTDCSKIAIQDLCGPRVLDLVLEVTDVSVPSDGNRATRKSLDRDHLAKASPDGKTIKLADLIDNTMSIGFWDPSFARTYLKEKRQLLPLIASGNAYLGLFATQLLTVAEEHVMDCRTAERTGWPR